MRKTTGDKKAKAAATRKPAPMSRPRNAPKIPQVAKLPIVVLAHLFSALGYLSKHKILTRFTAEETVGEDKYHIFTNTDLNRIHIAVEKNVERRAILERFIPQKHNEANGIELDLRGPESEDEGNEERTEKRQKLRALRKEIEALIKERDALNAAATSMEIDPSEWAGAFATVRIEDK